MVKTKDAPASNRCDHDKFSIFQKRQVREGPNNLGPAQLAPDGNIIDLIQMYSTRREAGDPAADHGGAQDRPE
ncbi:hypothetical protein ACFSTD_23735 [Novosphingobium colocasiae]|uniref:hypothetical protein n=1 Tax=Novosphingobium colocasiae TaxID=1256513 RepID=UPI001E64DDCA|nr:hypothetical protein [Novosphingobium colocasiae]